MKDRKAIGQKEKSERWSFQGTKLISYDAMVEVQENLGRLSRLSTSPIVNENRELATGMARAAWILRGSEGLIVSCIRSMIQNSFPSCFASIHPVTTACLHLASPNPSDISPLPFILQRSNTTLPTAIQHSPAYHLPYPSLPHSNQSHIPHAGV